MAGRARLRPGLEREVAARLVAPVVDRFADAVRDKAREHAPDARVWRAQGDDRVRPTHREADGQTIPANLRFLVRTPDYDRVHHDPHEWQLLRAPRDREGGSPGNVIECRCSTETLPGLIARHVERGPVAVTGTRVRARVSVRFPRIVESEYGTDKDRAARFMGRAARDARLG